MSLWWPLLQPSIPHFFHCPRGDDVSRLQKFEAQSLFFHESFVAVGEFLVSRRFFGCRVHEYLWLKNPSPSLLLVVLEMSVGRRSTITAHSNTVFYHGTVVEPIV